VHHFIINFVIFCENNIFVLNKPILALKDSVNEMKIDNDDSVVRYKMVISEI